MHMKKAALPLAIFALTPFLYAAPAEAATAYVSESGTDTGTCPQTAPCATLDFALTKSGANGKITILGHGDFQSLSTPITGGLTINAHDGGVSIKQNSLSQPVFTIAAAATDQVTLSGLSIGGGSAGTVGVQINSGGKIQLQNLKLKGFSNGAALALFIQPDNGGAGQCQVYITNGEVSNASVGLILVQPRNNTVVKTYFLDTEVHNTSGFGIKSDGTNGSIDNAITNSAFFSMTGAGVNALTPPGGTNLVRVSLDRTTMLNIGASAVMANGPVSRVVVFNSLIEGSQTGVTSVAGGGVVLDNAVITGNGTGVSIVPGAPSGAVFSAGNNEVKFNGTAQCGADICAGAAPASMGAAPLQ